MNEDQILDLALDKAINLASKEGEAYIFAYKDLFALVDKNNFKIYKDDIQIHLKNYMKNYCLSDLPILLDKRINELNKDDIYEFSIYFMILWRLRCIGKKGKIKSKNKFCLKIIYDDKLQQIFVDENPTY